MKTAVAVYTNKAITATDSYSSNIVQISLDAYNAKSTVIVARIQNGSVPPFIGSTIEIQYAFSSLDYSGALYTVPEIFSQDAESIILKFNDKASSVRMHTSGDIPIDGKYLYTWLNFNRNIGEWNATATLNVDAVLSKHSDSFIPKSTTVHTNGYAASLIAKASAGSVLSLIGYNSHSENQFIQIHDSATLPSEGTVPAATIIAEKGNNFGLDVPICGMDFQNGIVVCNSTTGPTKTIGGSNCFFTVSIL